MPPEISILHQDDANPLDSVEEVLAAHDWAFNRMTDDELMVQVAGKACDYRLFFIWQADMNAMQFCCQYDMTVTKTNMADAAEALMELNENLWMGHFDIPKDTRIPSFRHTCLMRGVGEHDSADQIEDLVDISLAQCERHYAVFYLLSKSGMTNTGDLSLSMMHTVGRA